MNSDYILDFTIPQGPTGPTGPAGITASGLKAYGGIYNNTPVQITLNSSQLYALNLPNTMPSLNVTYQGIDSLIIEQDGIYEINYGCVYSATTVYGSIKSCTLRVQASGVDVPGSVITNTVKNSDEVTPTIYGSINNSVIAELKTGDNIYLLFSSTSGGVISFSDGVNAILTVKQIN